MPFDRPDIEYNIEKIAELPSKPIYAFVKRLFDITVSVIGIILLLLPMLIAYIGIAATSKGNPIYKQERLGLNGKRFYIYKFRTMYENAEANGAQWSRGEADERITPFGKFLRRTKFDEIPQLFNCLAGDLSIVGPRPEREIFYDCFETYIHGFSQRLLVKPGITGLAQINGGYFLKPEEKIIYDIEYIKTRSLRTDFKILLSTVSVVIRGDGSK
ncbi:MAG: sugar transferase [Monoglobaceae bacterium]